MKISRKEQLRKYLDFIYAYEYSLHHDPLIRVPETKEDLEYCIKMLKNDSKDFTIKGGD